MKMRSPALAAGVIALLAVSMTSSVPALAQRWPDTRPPQGEVAEFSGAVWVDAAYSYDHVEARIDGVVCGEADPLIISGAGPWYDVWVVSEAVKPGCGKPGATITFFIGGRQANETAVWRATGETFEPLTLTVGPPFAQFHGDFTLVGPSRLVEVVPLIGDTVCGRQVSEMLGEGPTYGYQVVVLPEELKPGCGTDGATVRFELVESETDRSIAAALGTATWRPGVLQEVNLAFPETPPEELPVAGPAEGLPSAGDRSEGSGTSYGWWVAAGAFMAGAAALALAGRSRRRGRRRR